MVENSSAGLKPEEAEALYLLLDENVGFFKTSETTPLTERVRSEQKATFLTRLTQEIPGAYWFQTEGFSTLELIFNGECFEVVAPAVSGEKRDVLKRTNERLQKLARHGGL